MSQSRIQEASTIDANNCKVVSCLFYEFSLMSFPKWGACTGLSRQDYKVKGKSKSLL